MEETDAVPPATESQPQTAQPKVKDKVTLVVFSGDLDKVLAAFNIATGAASMGMDVTMFFTFWGLNVLKKNRWRSRPKGLMKKMLSRMNKGGTDQLPMSKFHMAGLGTWMMKTLMVRHRIPSVEEMMKLSKSLGVQMIACTVSMDLMGISQEDLISEIDSYAGVITYLAEARQGKVNLFI